MSAPTEEPDWDPWPPEREWYRHESSGERGYRVRRGGKNMIKLDRPMEELLQPMGDWWKRDEYGTLFLPEQIARVAFAADRGFCALIGLHRESRLTWQDIPEKARTEFLKKGPPVSEHPGRRKLYEAIFEAMKPYTRA